MQRSNSGQRLFLLETILLSLLTLSFFLIIFISKPVLAANDCVDGNGVSAQINRKTAPFSALTVDGTFNVIVTCGLPDDISLTGDSNILPHILTTVDNGKMEITASRSICCKIPVVIKISLPTLKAITADGACDIDVNKINNETFVASSDGAVTVRLQGTTQKFTLKADGSSTIHCANLQASEVVAKTYGSSTAEVHALKLLDAECHDASDLKYSGNPKSKNLQAFDACDLTAL